MSLLSPKYGPGDKVVVQTWLSGKNVSVEFARANLERYQRAGTVREVTRAVAQITQSVPRPGPWYKLDFDESFPGCDAWWAEGDIVDRA
jgi:hypothetical protein